MGHLAVVDSKVWLSTFLTLSQREMGIYGMRSMVAILCWSWISMGDKEIEIVIMVSKDLRLVFSAERGVE